MVPPFPELVAAFVEGSLPSTRGDVTKVASFVDHFRAESGVVCKNAKFKTPLATPVVRIWQRMFLFISTQ